MGNCKVLGESQVLFFWYSEEGDYIFPVTLTKTNEYQNLFPLPRNSQIVQSLYWINLELIAQKSFSAHFEKSKMAGKMAAKMTDILWNDCYHSNIS